MHRVSIRTLANLADALTAVDAAGEDIVLVLPAGASTLVLASEHELVEAGRAFRGSICVAATPVPLSSPDVAAKMADAVARSSGWRPVRVHPHPYAMLGRADKLFALAADVAAARSPAAGDADLIAIALVEGSHELVLDLAGEVFHTLDGTGTDAVPLAGRVQVGGEQPLVILDVLGTGEALRRLEADLSDPGGRDLARLLRYDGAIDPPASPLGDPHLTTPALEIVSTPFWTPAFCETVIRAAELADRWAVHDNLPTPRSEVALRVLSPRLHALTDQDLRGRILPRVVNHWPETAAAMLQEAVIVRCEAGEANLMLSGRPSDPSGAQTARLETARLETAQLQTAQLQTAQLKGLVPLNTGYLGGAQFFPRQAWDDRRVPVGTLTLWPSAQTHPHRIESVSRGVRYTLSLSWRAGPP
jgi:hypothetical protein